jgi:hypothetical protein
VEAVADGGVDDGGVDDGDAPASSGVGPDDVHDPTVAATIRPDPARRNVRRLRSWVMER